MPDALEVRLTRLEDCYNHIEERLSDVEERLGGVENRVNYLRAEMSTGFSELRSKTPTRADIDNLRRRMNTQFYWLVGFTIVMNLIASYLF